MAEYSFFRSEPFANGQLNLFFRPKSHRHFSNTHMTDLFSTRAMYIVQFNGNPDFDSGYVSVEFNTLEEAMEYFEMRMETSKAE